MIEDREIACPDHGFGIRCMDCMTDREFDSLPETTISILAEKINWAPSESLIIDLTLGVLL